MIKTLEKSARTEDEAIAAACAADINAAIAEDIAAGNCRITDSAQAAEHDAVLKELVGQLVEAGKWVFD